MWTTGPVSILCDEVGSCGPLDQYQFCAGCLFLAQRSKNYIGKTDNQGTCRQRTMELGDINGYSLYSPGLQSIITANQDYLSCYTTNTTITITTTTTTTIDISPWP